MRSQPSDHTEGLGKKQAVQSALLDNRARPPCPRVRRPHGALRAGSPCSTPCVIDAGTTEQSVRSTVVEAADQPTSTSCQGRGWVKPRPSPQGPTFGSTLSPSSNGARRPPSVETGHARTPVHQARGAVPRLHLSGCTFGRAPPTNASLGPACKVIRGYLCHVLLSAMRASHCGVPTLPP